jgi:hypothetical protein
MKKGTAIASFGAATLALGVATGFIHKAEPSSPEQCFDDYIKATAPLMAQAAPAVMQNSALYVTETPDMRQKRAIYMDCMDTYAKSAQGFTIGLGWK